MNSLLIEKLKLEYAKSTGERGSGCISSGNVYDTNIGKIFVKENSKMGADIMFDGEMMGLQKIWETKTITVPKPILSFSDTKSHYFAMEYLDMKPTRRNAAELGEKLTRLHRHNEDVCCGTDTYVSKFGFDVPTCCGFIPQDNIWEDDWVKFYTNNRLKVQLDLIEKTYHDKDARMLWPQVEKNIPLLFKGMKIIPSLLHGDLWSGNVSSTESGPCIYDCAAFYGHSEYDLGIATLFGGFSAEFYNSYHKIIQKKPGFENRNKLYQLFHYLNHWNHFGSGYKSSSISIMTFLSTIK